MEQLATIKEQLIAQVQGQMGNLQKVNTKELGEVIDMIKDLSEAIYYCSIYEAMEEAEEKGGGTNSYYYTEKYLPYPYDDYRDMEYRRGRMYYSGGGSSGGSGGGSSGGSSSGGGNSGSSGGSGGGRGGSSSGGGNSGGSSYYSENPRYMGGNDRKDYFHEEDFPMSFRDDREGRSGLRRKMYMESKQTHSDSSKKIQELENYMKELTSDITEMISDASPEEKAVLQKKMNILATKIQNV